MKEIPQAVVLCSGGMDSVTALAWIIAEGYKTHVLFVNYNQKTKKREQKASQEAAQRFGASWKKIDFSDLSKITATSLIHDQSNKQNRTIGTEVQGRNTILIGLGVAYAQTLGIEKVIIGIQEADVEYGDAKPEYFRYISQAMKVAYNITLEAPLLYKSKKEIIQLALKLNVDLNQTYSCYFNEINPCGNCPSCLVRNQAELNYK
ncbi:MAG: 7-cyano-7-deazaguanine synthase [Candidatus Hodarchaeales archaeon]